MLDLKFVRKNPEAVKEALTKRGSDMDVDAFLKVDERRRELLQEVEALKAERNQTSGEIAKRKRAKEDASDLMARMGEVSKRVKELDGELAEVETEQKTWLAGCPNIPHESVPEGSDEDENVEVRRWGTPREFVFPPREHWELGVELGGLDFERAAKLTGSRFTVYYDWAARMERALSAFMIDVHTTEHDYMEITPPFIVNRDSLYGTGQLPKFAEDLFKLEDWEYFLTPTAEVPVTNLYRNEVVEGQPPIAFCSLTPCFRSEAGSYGKDTKGLIRQHQFYKVEMVRFAHPDDSYEQLELMTGHAEKILQKLELPYRVITLCTGDMGFSAAKTYDLEVWLPGQAKYREISSCSNTEDFQARRANIRFRPEGEKKPRYLHTLNGSGLAVGRTLVAIIENYQQADGSVVVPEALRPYMGGLEIIEPVKAPK